MSANSDIKLCNVALAKLGAELISSFNEQSKAARLCKTLYPMLRDELTSEHAWSCMRKTATLNLTEDESDIGTYVYTLPSDCIMPLNILPLGSFNSWHLVGNTIITEVYEAVLLYTYNNVNPELFNWPFMRALINRLIIYLAPSIKGDSDAVEKLVKESEARIMLAKADDANIGSEYVHPDEDINNDSFVNPDGSTV